MKRLTSFILAAVFALSLLAGCGGGTEASPAPGTSGEPGTDAPAVSSAPEASSAPGASYLADPMFDTDEYLPDYDADNRFLKIAAGLVETENVNYFVLPNGIPYVMFSDRQTGICAPLCGKPECEHNGPDCNAYTSGNSLFMYDGMLWFISNISEHYLYRMKPDGTDRETVKKLEYPAAAPHGIINYTTALHRGYVYHAWLEDVLEDGAPASRLCIAAEGISSDDKVSVLDKTYPGRNAVERFQLRFSGNHLCIMLRRMIEDGGRYRFPFELYDWNSKTRTLTQLVNTDDHPSLEASDFWVTEDGGIILACTDTSAEDGKAYGLYRYDLAAGTLELYREYETCVVELGDGVVETQRASWLPDGSFDARMAAFEDPEGNVLYEGSVLPEGTTDEQFVGYFLIGGDRNSVYLKLLWAGRVGIVRITLGDEPKAELLWRETEEGRLTP